MIPKAQSRLTSCESKFQLTTFRLPATLDLVDRMSLSRIGDFAGFLGISKKALSFSEATRDLFRGPGPISERF